MKTIRPLREERGWSQAELARRARLNATTVSLIESNRLRPYATQLTKLADAFRLSGHARRNFIEGHDA